MSDFEQAQTPSSTGSGYNHYGISGEQKNESGSYQNWTGWGSGVGNRKDDTPQPDEKDANAPHSVKNSKMGAPSIDMVDLDGLRPEGVDPYDTNGVYRESLSGVKPWENKWGEGKRDQEGKLSAELWSGSTVAGVREQTGIRGRAKTEGKYGTALAQGDAYAVAEAGADAKAKLGTDGFEASTHASTRAGVGVNGDASLTSKDGRLASMQGIVDDELNMGVGVHGDAFVGGKLGAGAKIGLGPEFIGAEAKVGGMLGAEANADIHGNLGPLKGKAGVSGIAGIGFEASGGISIEDWKLHIGGKIGAALGLGGSVSVDATLDLKQTAQLAQWAGKQICNGVQWAGQKVHDGLDRDGDGKLTLNDAAKGVGELAQGGANLIDKGWDGAQKLLDGDKDGKFSFNDVKIRADQAKDWLASKGSQALGWAGDQVNAAGKALHNMADRDGDGKIGVGDLVAGAAQAKEFAKEKIGQAGQALGNAKDWAVDKAKQAGTWLKKKADLDGDGKVGIGDVFTGIGEVKNFAGEKIQQIGGAIGAAKDWAVDKAGDAKDWLLEKAANAGSAIKNAADRDGDGKVGFSDLVTGLGQAKEFVGEKAGAAGKAIGNALGAAKDWAGDKLHSAKDAIHNAADRDGDGKVDWHDAVAGAGQLKNWAGDKLSSAGKTIGNAVGAAKDWASDKLHAAKDTIHNAADRDGDGKVDWHDAVAGAGQLKNWAGDKVSAAGKTIGNAVGAAKDWAGDKVASAKKAVTQAADRDGDGKIGWGDVKAGASQAKEWAGDKISSAGKAIGAAKDWVGNKASAAWDGAKSAGSTLVSGVSGAAKTVGGTLKKAKDFFGGW
ncbi:MAG TPA: hypothetical protein PKL17_06310 [Pseudomonadota bacterium]|nr:hypothetical protein [Pseudomonadota bacterium]